MAISRLFVEIGRDTDRLDQSLRAAMKSAEEAGIKVEASGKRMLSAFDKALNPTRELGEQIQLLEMAGKSSADIWKVYEDRVKQAADAQQKMGTAIDPTVQRLIDQNKQIERAATNWKELGTTLTRAGQGLSSFGRSYSLYVTAPLVATAGMAVKVAGEFQQIRIAFDTMLGSEEKAAAFLKDMEDFAKSTPFEFKDLTDASKRMLALGFSAEQVLPTMRTIGDAVAGLGGGSETINRVTLALGQMQAKGKVSAEEMRQLAEAGIPAWQSLAENIGVSIPEAMKLAQKGAIEASTAIPAILAGMTDRFGGMMEAQSQTLLGQISNMKDEFYFIMRDLGQTLIPVATEILQEFIKPMAENLKGLVDWFAQLGDAEQELVVKFAAMAAAAGPLAIGLGAVASGIGNVITLASGGAGLKALIENLGDIDIFATKAAGGMGLLGKAITAAAASYVAIQWKDIIAGVWELSWALNSVEKGTQGLEASSDKLRAAMKDKFQFEALSREQFFKSAGMSDTNDINELAERERLYGKYLGDMASSLRKFNGDLGKIARDGISDVAANAMPVLTEAQKAELEKLRKEMTEVFNASYWGPFDVNIPKPFDLNVEETSRRLGAQNLNSFNAEIEAVLEKYRQISISTEQFRESWDAIGKAGVEATEIDAAILGEAEDRITQMMERSRDFTTTAQEEQLETIRQYYDDLDELRERDLISEEEYSNAKKRLAAEETIVKLSNARTFFGNLAELQTSHIRAIAAIGKAAAIAQATINTYEGATKALAQGGIWGALNMAAVMAAGFAQVAAISSQGFKEGGFTGLGSPDEVAGFVHGQEFVMDADVTRRYRPLLEALQNNTLPQGSSYDGGTAGDVGGLMRPALQVSIQNYGTSKAFDVEMDAGTVRVIARDEALSVLTQRGPEVIAADLAYANSRTSKALAKHTTARRGDR